MKAISYNCLILLEECFSDIFSPSTPVDILELCSSVKYVSQYFFEKALSYKESKNYDTLRSDCKSYSLALFKEHLKILHKDQVYLSLVSKLIISIFKKAAKAQLDIVLPPNSHNRFPSFSSIEETGLPARLDHYDSTANVFLDEKLTQLIKLISFSKEVLSLLDEIISPSGLESFQIFQEWFSIKIWDRLCLRMESELFIQAYYQLLCNNWALSANQMIKHINFESNIRIRLMQAFPIGTLCEDTEINPQFSFDRINDINLLQIPSLLKVDSAFSNSFIKGVTERVADNVDLNLIEVGLNNLVIPWLIRLSQIQTRLSELSEDFTKRRLFQLAMSSFCEIRIKTLDAEITDFPRSLKYMEELGRALSTLDSKTIVEHTAVKESLSKHLNSINLSATQLLFFLYKSIAAVSYLDPSGLFLECVIALIQPLILSRKDGVSSLVSDMLERDFEHPDSSLGGLVLDDCLAKAGFRPETMPCVVTSTPEILKNNSRSSFLYKPTRADCKWRQIETDTNNLGTTGLTISLLIGFFESPEILSDELFITMIKIAAQTTIITSEFIGWFESKVARFKNILKESHLKSLLIVQKDFQRSLTTNAHINKRLKTDIYQVKQRSKAGWPPFEKTSTVVENMYLPPALAHLLTGYSGAFTEFTFDMRLSWNKSHTVISLNVELPTGCNKNISVSLAAAAVLFSFLDQPIWKLDDLSFYLRIPCSALGPLLGIWLDYGVIYLISTDTYQAWDHSSELFGTTQNIIIDESSSEDDQDEYNENNSPILYDADYYIMKNKYFSWITHIVKRASTPPSIEKIYKELNTVIMPPNSLQKLYDIHTFQAFMDRLTEEKCLTVTETNKYTTT